jgi:hypothetical protein
MYHALITEKIILSCPENKRRMKGQVKLCVDDLCRRRMGGKVLDTGSYGIEHLARIRVADLPVWWRLVSVGTTLYFHVVIIGGVSAHLAKTPSLFP